MKEITINGIRYYTMQNENNCIEELQLVSNDNEVCILKLSLDFMNKTPTKYTLCWEESVLAVCGFWKPMCRFRRNVMPDWAKRCTLSKTAYNAPIAVLFDNQDRNCVAVTISDVYNGTEIKSGVHEENAKHIFEINFFALGSEPISKYQTLIRIDRRKLPFSQTIKEASFVWREWGCKDAPVPNVARQPVYSTWYNFHQQVNTDDILAELKMAKNLGFETVIIDDGWQTEDNSRGYGYCGDWHVAKSKIPNMKNFVDRVHSLGMKFMLWYAVPFIGIHSVNYKRFEGKYLYYDKSNQAGTLDPRFKEVRQFLVNLYTEDMKTYGYDGYKLDFIDSMYLTDESSKNYDEMDCLSVEEGVKKLLLEIGESLREINPDVLIEFRQGYFGPGVTSLGNMIRVSDCPADGLSNRVGSIDLKMTLLDSATHCDMLLWESNESVEFVARQLLDVLFAVPQISVKLANLKQSHLQYLRKYLNFRKKHSHTIDFGKFQVKGVGANYTQAISSTEEESIVVCYSDSVVKVDNQLTYVFNATYSKKLYLELGESNKTISVYDVNWKQINRLTASNLVAIELPLAGHLKIEG